MIYVHAQVSAYNGRTQLVSGVLQFGSTHLPNMYPVQCDSSRFQSMLNVHVQVSAYNGHTQLVSRCLRSGSIHLPSKYHVQCDSSRFQSKLNVHVQVSAYSGHTKLVCVFQVLSGSISQPIAQSSFLKIFLIQLSVL